MQKKTFPLCFKMFIDKRDFKIFFVSLKKKKTQISGKQKRAYSLNSSFVGSFGAVPPQTKKKKNQIMQIINFTVCLKLPTVSQVNCG